MTDKWNAVILAGGLGSRLNPLTANICKPMVPVANKPMVDYAIDHLQFAGIKKIIIVVKHLGEELRALIQSTWTSELQAKLGIEILVPNVDSRGTADAVRKVAHLIDSENFVVSMADIVTNLPMQEFMEFHERKNAQATVSMKRIEEMASKYGNALIDDDSRIIRFLEKPSSDEIYLSALTGGTADTLPIINTGIYCFNRDILDLIMSTDFMDFGKNIFPYLLENKYDLYGFVRDYYWLDVGNPTTYLWSNWDVLRLYGFPITPNGVRQGRSHVWYINNENPGISHEKNICFGHSNTFGPKCQVKELSTIGSHCIFGENVIVNRSVIWDHCKIGNNVRIEQSVIADWCEIGDNCVIRSNTIIGPHTKISPNTTLDSQTIKEDQSI
ncbi:MAG: sugar phosphate nucleotidyltransferase [Promethearchaeota archaeon]